MTTSSRKPEDICKTGDLILRSDDDKQTWSYRVNSLLLANASPVFKTMLTGPFKEGQDSSGTKEISVNDDGQCSKLFLEVLHYVPMSFGNFTSNKVYRMVVIADKYDAVLVITGFIMNFLEYITREPNVFRPRRQELADLLSITILGKLPVMFEKIVALICKYHVGQVTDLTQGHESIITNTIIFCIEWRRAELLNDFNHLLFSTVVCAHKLAQTSDFPGIWQSDYDTLDTCLRDVVMEGWFWALKLGASQTSTQDYVNKLAKLIRELDISGDGLGALVTDHPGPHQ